MPQRRTKKEKVRAKRRPLTMPVVAPEFAKVLALKSAPEQHSDSLVSFFPYNVSLIYQDLLKTALVTLFVVVLLFGISQTVS